MKFAIFAMGKSTKDLTPEAAAKAVDSWLKILNAESDEPIIEIDGVIGEDWWGESQNTVKAIKKKLADIANLKASKITVNINSLGGDVSHGLGIHDILAQHDAEIVTNVQGLTASAATIIAQAGDVRQMSDNALYLIHQPWSFFMSNVSELENDLDNMRTINDRLVKIYTKRSGKPEAEIRALMDEDNGNGKWISAQEAEEMGLIDEVYEPMKAAAMVIPEAAANMPLPKLPKLPGADTGGADNNDNTQILNIMKKELMDMFASLKGWFTDNFKKEGSEESEIPEAAQAKLGELEAKINEVGDQEEKVTTLEASVQTLTGERDTAVADLATRGGELETANAKITKLETDLAKAKGGSTKPKGKEGGEDIEKLGDTLNQQLSADLAKIKGE